MPKSAGCSFYGNGMSCNKPAKTYLEQLEILKARGLIIVDEALALHCLMHHNYYRLSAYRFPLTSPGNSDQFFLVTLLMIFGHFITSTAPYASWSPRR